MTIIYSNMFDQSSSRKALLSTDVIVASYAGRLHSHVLQLSPPTSSPNPPAPRCSFSMHLLYRAAAHSAVIDAVADAVQFGFISIVCVCVMPLFVLTFIGVDGSSSRVQDQSRSNPVSFVRSPCRHIVRPSVDASIYPFYNLICMVDVVVAVEYRDRGSNPPSLLLPQLPYLLQQLAVAAFVGRGCIKMPCQNARTP